MKRFGVGLLCLLVLLVALFIVCKSPPVQAPAEEDFLKEDAPGSHAVTVSQEMYDFTLAEVKVFIDSLNSLIMKKDYDGWKDSLSDEFFAHISSREFLTGASESAALKSRKITLKTPNDYFSQVVVPSRSNSRVDEIEFTAADRVKVFYREERVRRNDGVSTTEVRRLRLYELIKIEDTWKIID